MSFQEFDLTPPARCVPGQILAYDDRDNRTQLIKLLRHLPPPARLAFDQWAAAQAVLGSFKKQKIEIAYDNELLMEQALRSDYDDERLTVTVLTDLTALATHYRLDLDGVVAELVRWVKHPHLRRPPKLRRDDTRFR